MARKLNSVAIVGSGPAGSTLAALLARAGKDVTIYTTGKRPPLLVGESLVPAIIPIMRELGVEDEVKSYSTYKPGATFFPTFGEELSYPFARIKGWLPQYAYNVPRAQFDQTIEDAAVRLGAKRIQRTVTYAKGEAPGTVRILPPEGGQPECEPDLIVDATGRTRALAKFLDLPCKQGDRQDFALFAHHDDLPIHSAGHIHIDRLKYGWAWRIPLPNRVSLGIVVHGDRLKEYGSTIEEQYDNYLKAEPILKQFTAKSKRITGVVKYNNYQMATEKLVGPGWALVGDSAGFVDPIFSSGLYLAMDSSRNLATAILKGSDGAMAAYEKYQLDHIRSWHKIVRYYYNGRMLTLLRLGNQMGHTPLGRIIDPHMHKHMGRLFTGAAGKARYSRKLLDFMATWGVSRLDHTLLKIN